jgi:hypothetical protein
VTGTEIRTCRSIGFQQGSTLVTVCPSCFSGSYRATCTKLHETITWVEYPPCQSSFMEASHCFILFQHGETHQSGRGRGGTQ